MCKRSVKKSKWKAILRQQNNNVEQKQIGGRAMKAGVTGAPIPASFQDFK